MIDEKVLKKYLDDLNGRDFQPGGCPMRFYMTQQALAAFIGAGVFPEGTTFGRYGDLVIQDVALMDI